MVHQIPVNIFKCWHFKTRCYLCIKLIVALFLDNSFRRVKCAMFTASHNAYSYWVPSMCLTAWMNFLSLSLFSPEPKDRLSLVIIAAQSILVRVSTNSSIEYQNCLLWTIQTRISIRTVLHPHKFPELTFLTFLKLFHFPSLLTALSIYRLFP